MLFDVAVPNPWTAVTDLHAVGLPLFALSLPVFCTEFPPLCAGAAELVAVHISADMFDVAMTEMFAVA